MPKFDDELLPGETLPTVEIETELTVAPVEGEQYSPSYKYSEDRILAEVKSYVDSTYGQHYSRILYISPTPRVNRQAPMPSSA